MKSSARRRAAGISTPGAVERKLGIVGEALNRLRNDHPEIAGRIPRLRRIVDFRNLLVHAHDRVDPDRVWTYAGRDLPELRRTVQVLLAEPGALEE